MGMCFWRQWRRWWRGGGVASHLGNADSLIIPSQVALPHLNGRLVLTFITIICQSVTSSSSSSFFAFFFRHFLLSGPNELKQLYSKCPRRGRYSHSLTHQFVRSPVLSFLSLSLAGWIANRRTVVFRQEMPNGFAKMYSWHGNEIQICKTFLTWKSGGCFLWQLCPVFFSFFLFLKKNKNK